MVSIFEPEGLITVHISDGTLGYYLMFFGLCSALFALSALCFWLAGLNKSKPSIQFVLSLIALLLGLCSIPAAFVFGLIYHLYIDRERQSIYQEEGEKWSEVYKSRPCPFCGHSRDEEDVFLDDSDL